MSSHKVFCAECRADVNYLETSVPMLGTIKGRVYHYSGKEARCAVCGSQLLVPELADANLLALYSVYRAENNLIPLEKVQAIPEKYAIGKRPLSLLLGWGEQTFSRYMEGDVPTKEYSATLERIYNEPAYYLELLEANKGKLKSVHAYEKSRRAVTALMGTGLPPASKIDGVSHYLVSQCEDITPLALQKALYYIQGFYFAFYQNFLFTEDCEAWQHGPVYRAVYYRYKDYRLNPGAPLPGFDATALSAKEKAVFDSVIDHLCCYSGQVLEQFTHKEVPWLLTRDDLPLSAPSQRIIKKILIGDYFCCVKEKYRMVNPSDIKDYAQEMFLRK